MNTKVTGASIIFPDDTQQSSASKAGIIFMWSGDLLDIPSGWQLCDGTNGTPDLRDKFIVCAGNTYTIGTSSGSESIILSEPQLPIHTHDVTISSVETAGSHSHGGSFASSFSGFGHTHSMSPSPIATATGPNNYNASPGGAFGTTNSTGPGGNHTHSYTITTDGTHTHTVSSLTVGPVGAGDAHENRPPFYALAFIMEIV